MITYQYQTNKHQYCIDKASGNMQRKLLPQLSFLLIIFLSVLQCGHSLKILSLLSYPGPSHFVTFEPLMKALHSRGHDMTVVSFFPKDYGENCTNIDLSTGTEKFMENLDMETLPTSRSKYYFSMVYIAYLSKENCDLLRHPKIVELAQSNQEFDLIILETWVLDCFYGFVHKFKAPFIGLTTCINLSWTSWRLGNPLTPSYIPAPTMPYSDDMSFLERIDNLITILYEKYTFDNWILKPSNAAAKKFFGEDLPDLDEIARNISLVLVNTHFTLSRPRPFVPNIVEVGGLFVKDLPKKLPKVRMQPEKNFWTIYLALIRPSKDKRKIPKYKQRF